MENDKSYIVESWSKRVERLDSLAEVRSLKRLIIGQDHKDIKVFEVEEKKQEMI